MLDSLHTQYPSYYLIGCALLGIAYAVSLYLRHKNFKEVKGYIPILLGILRAIAVAAIAYFLLVPVLERFKSRTQNAIVVVAKDTSQSIREGMSEQGYADYLAGLKSLEDELGQEFQVEEFNFSDRIAVTDTTGLSNLSTDLGKALAYIENQYSDQHVGAVILATDGIFNEGRNPLYVGNDITAPVYSIALGDTTIRKDILIKNLLYNKIAYLGDKSEIQVDVQATNVAGAKSSVTLARIVDNKPTKIDEKVITMSGNDYFETVSFIVENKSPGNVQYRVSVGSVANEISTSNNSKNAYVDVIDARQEIFIIANAPHPDIHTLNKTLSTNKNYKISRYYGDDNIPIAKADVVVLHNLPSVQHPIKQVMTSIKSKKTPRIFITGAQTDAGALISNDVGLKISGAVGQTNESQASVKSGFNKFVVSEEIKNNLKSYPPLISPFGEYELSTSAEVLADQRINGIETNYPLIAFDQSQGIRKVFINGEGIWKWRLFNFLQNDNHEAFDELLKKIFQFASVKDDKRKFRVNIAKNNYKVNETIFLDAQLYNDVYELINTPEARLKISSSAGESYDYTFTRTDNYYVVNAGALKEGTYTYTGTTSLEGVELKSTGTFRVETIQKESYNLTANHGLLYQLSDKYKGAVYKPSEIGNASTEILANANMKPIIYQEKDNRPLMHYPWLLLPILLLLGIEWFVRRYTGGY